VKAAGFHDRGDVRSEHVDDPVLARHVLLLRIHGPSAMRPTEM
jgi:hypothetical protein